MASAAALAYAAGLRATLGFADDEATVERAAEYPTSFPITTLGAPMTVEEGAEVDRRIKVQVSLGGAIDEAERQPSFAGAWIDQLAGGVPVLQFTKLDSDVVSRLSTLMPKETPYRFTEAMETLGQLRARRDAIVADMGELAKLGIEVTGSGIDVPGNRTTVTIAKATAEAAATLRTKYGDRLLVVEGAAATADGCPADGCLPLKGGIGMIGKSTVWPCTVGYLAKRTDVSPDVLVIVTAGHCVQYGSGPTGNPWHHGTTNIGYGINSPVSGKIETYFNYSGADVGLISIFSNVIPSTKNQILVDESPVTVRNVEAVQPWDHQIQGRSCVVWE